MKVYICIDDTDNKESIGTGHLAARLIDDIAKMSWGTSSFITRHQLFVHPDVPYTSHNSAMCFTSDLAESCIDEVIDHASFFLRRHSAPGSDPGLCVAVAGRLQNCEALIAFGKKAKHQVLDKIEAYDLAKQHGIHLSEHGGTGGGVIGALAGVGLRMGGNDGRVRGKLSITGTHNSASVAAMLGQAGIDEIRPTNGNPIDDHERILLGEWIKTVYLDGRRVLLVKPLDRETGGPKWRICEKEELKIY
jgi:hypothetical protein